ncbi:hypothetical protein ABVT39_012129 [Epinephelus coioides]
MPGQTRKDFHNDNENTVPRLRRTKNITGIAPEATNDMAVCKPKTRRGVRTGAKCTLYRAYAGPLPDPHMMASAKKLRDIRPQPGICKMLYGLENLNLVDSKFGPVPFGSVLPYQCPSEKTKDIIRHLDAPAFPQLPVDGYSFKCPVHFEPNYKQKCQLESLKLAALKLDPDLDGNPPFCPSAPPPYNSATPNKRRCLPQQKTCSEAAHPEVPVPPQNSTTTPSSPVAHRLRHPNQNAAFNMPMVEVSGPEGTTLVFHPWTSADITAASQHLPNPTTSGKMFAEQFFTFCQEFKPTMNELKRLLITKMKPTDWQKIAGKIPDADIRCKHITWEDES